MPCGGRSSSTMIVMMMAITPSLNASRRPLLMRVARVSREPAAPPTARARLRLLPRPAPDALRDIPHRAPARADPGAADASLPSGPAPRLPPHHRVHLLESAASWRTARI